MVKIRFPNRFSFSLRALFAGVAVVGVIAAIVVGYSQAERRFANAQAQYDKVRAYFDAGMGTTMDLCAESFVLHLAERGRWFRSGAAVKKHVDRLKEIEDHIEAKIPFTLYSDAGISEKQTLRDIRTMRERFEKGDF